MTIPRQLISLAQRTQVPTAERSTKTRAAATVKPLLAAAAGLTAVGSLLAPASAQAATTTYDIRGAASNASVVGKEIHISASVTPNVETTQCIVTEVQNPSLPAASRTLATVKNSQQKLAPGWPLTVYQDWTPTAAGTYASVVSIYDPTCTTKVQTVQTSTFKVAATATATAAKRPFAATSSWNTTVPTTANYGKLNWPAASNPWVYYTNWRDNGSTPVYTATSTDPLVTVTIQGASNWGRSTAPVQLHIPKGANGAKGWYVSSGTGAKWFGDGELTVIDGTTVWQFHEFRRTSDTTATVNVYGKTDINTGTGWGDKSGVGAGTMAVGASELAGLLTQRDNDDATIDHALQLVVDACSNVFGQPVGEAINADGERNADGTAVSWSSCPGTAQVLLHEGQRLAIPRSVSLSSISGLSPLGKKVFTALQNYGAYDVDSSHGPQALVRMQANAFNQSTQTALQADMAKLIPLLQTVNATAPTTSTTTAPSTSTTAAPSTSTTAAPSTSTTTAPSTSTTAAPSTSTTAAPSTSTTTAPSTSSTTAPTTSTAAIGSVVWRQTGAWTAVKDAAGNIWQARGANMTTGGAQNYHADGVTATVAGATDQAIYRSMANGLDSWTVPTGNGTYKVQLFTTEDYFGSAGQRVFNVTAEGKTVLTGVDAFGATGAKDKAYEPTFTATVTDGTLNIGFANVANVSDIAAIQVTRVA